MDSNNDATISGDQVTTRSGLMALCDDYGKPPQSGPANDVNAVKAPVVGMAVFNLSTGDFLGTVTSVASAHSFTLSKSPGDTSGAGLLLSAYGGCGPADYAGGGPGIKSGKPAAYYWDNCMLGSRNVTVSHNTFSINANVVKGCTAANNCGFQQLIAFNAGVPTLMQFFDSYANLIGKSAKGLGNSLDGQHLHLDRPRPVVLRSRIAGNPRIAVAVARCSLRPGREQRLLSILAACDGNDTRAEYQGPGKVSHKRHDG